jgi:hypothetical protein
LVDKLLIMKKLIFLFSLVVCAFVTEAQMINGRYYNPLGNYNQHRGLTIDSNLNIPRVIPQYGFRKGAIMFDTTQKVLRVYDGLTWIYQMGIDSIYFSTGGGTDTMHWRAIGTWYQQTMSGGSGLSDGDKGDLTVSSGGTVWTIDNGVITNAKINDVAWSKITGVPSFVTDFSAGDLSPLFTTSEATTTTTPALTFSLSNTTQYKVFGRSASGSGAPSYIDLDTAFIPNFYTKVRSLSSLDHVTTVGNFTNNEIRTGTGGYSIMNSGNSTQLGAFYNVGNNTSELYIPQPSTGKASTLSFDYLQFTRSGYFSQTLKPYPTPGTAVNFTFPNTATNRYVPVTFKLNGTTVSAGDTGLVDLGTISGGVAYTLINGGNNLGSGSQLFKDTSSNKLNFRSLTAGWGLIVTQNTNDVEYKADTSKLATSTAVRDTAAALRYLYSGESVAWGTSAQRMALTPTNGQRFTQTDERIGEWVYVNDRWYWQPHDLIFRMNQYGTFSSHFVSGTGSSGGAAFGQIDTIYGSGAYVFHNTSVGSYAYLAGAGNLAMSPIWSGSDTNNVYIIHYKIRLSALPTQAENYRAFWGLNNYGGAPINDSAAVNSMGFRLAWHRGNGYIQAYMHDYSTLGAGPAPGIAVADLVPATLGAIDCVMLYTDKSAQFWVNGVKYFEQKLVDGANSSSFRMWTNPHMFIYKLSGSTAVSLGAFDITISRAKKTN